MPKIFLSLLVFYLYFAAGACFSFADPQPATPVAENPIIKLNSQDIDKLFKNEEVILKKIKAEHVRQERKQHVLNTEIYYQEAKSLYRQKRRVQAKRAFTNVEDSIPDYKMTNTFLRVIDAQALVGFRQRMLRIKEIEGAKLAINLSDKADRIYQQMANLDHDKDIVAVRGKLFKVKEVLEKLKQEKIAAARKVSQKEYVQERLDEIAKRADDFDQEVVGLINSKDYQAAKKKYEEFQEDMADELMKLKHNTSSEDSGEIAANSHERLLQDKVYKKQEQDVFRQGIELYKNKQYYEAKSIFDELGYQGDRRAQAYSRKIDRLLQSNGF